MSAETLKPFPQLIAVSFEKNNLVTIDDDLFKYTPKLVWLAFAQNQIVSVGFGLLDGFELAEVYFNNNPCINMYAGTPDQVRELIEQLLIRCPPSETTTSLENESSSTTLSTLPTPEINECSIGCQKHIKSVENDVLSELAELRNLAGKQQEKIEWLVAESEIQKLTILSYEERIVELEKMMREIGSMP